MNVSVKTRFALPSLVLAVAIGVGVATGLAGPAGARADSPGPISFNGAKSELQSDMGTARSDSANAASSAREARSWAADALRSAKEARDAALRCDKERYEKWKALYEDELAESEKQSANEAQWQSDSQAAEGQAQKRLSDMEFFADAGNATQAADIESMTNQLQQTIENDLNNLANEQANEDQAGTLRAHARDAMDDADFDIDLCDEDNMTMPPDPTPDDTVVTPPTDAQPPTASDPSGAAQDGSQATGDGSDPGSPQAPGDGSNPGTSPAASDGSGSLTPQGNGANTPLAGSPSQPWPNDAGTPAQLGVYLARSECRDGFWHVVTYNISDPSHWVEITDEKTDQPCQIPATTSGTSVSGANNGSNGFQPNTMPGAGQPNTAGAQGGTSRTSNAGGVLFVRSECRSGFWHVVTYDISDPSHWVEVSDEATAQPCQVASTSSSTSPAGASTGSNSVPPTGPSPTSGQPTATVSSDNSTQPTNPTGSQAPAATGTPAVHLSQPGGPSGMQVVIDGQGFTPGSHLFVRWQGADGSCMDVVHAGPSGIVVSPTGSFTATFIVPTGAPGPHVIVVHDQSGRQATASFNVVPGGPTHS